MIDVIYIPVAIFVILVITVFAYGIAYSIQEAAPFQIFGLDANAFSTFMLGIYFGLPIVGLILALISGGEPILALVGILFLVLGAFLGGILKDLMVRIFPEVPGFSAFSSNQIFSKAIDYYPFAMFIFGIIMVVAQFIGMQK